jgi:acylphosphatase
MSLQPSWGHDGAGAGADGGLGAWSGTGVEFRWWTRCWALELGLAGHAANLSDGRVEVVAEGSREACERLLAALLRSGSTSGHAHQVTERFGDARGGVSGFVERSFGRDLSNTSASVPGLTCRTSRS